MCARLLACPLCTQPGFLTLDALRAGLISVATRPLTCPVCNEVLLGIDKLTIHLFSHTINLSGNNAIVPTKHINVSTSNNNTVIIPNSQNATFQDFNVSKMQTTDLNKPSETNLNIDSSLKSSKNLQTSKDEVVVNSEICIEDQSLSLNYASQVAFSSDVISEMNKVNIIHHDHKNKEMMIEGNQNIQQVLPEIKLNYPAQYYTNNNVKYVNLVQNYNQTEHETIQILKQWNQDQHSEQQISKFENINQIEKSTQNEKHCVSKQNHSEQLATMNKFSHITSTCTNASLENINNEKNIQDSLCVLHNKREDENTGNQRILPQLKILKPSPVKEKTERCNICGFHFPDCNILLLHKQLVHMINEKDLDVIPENFLKSYSCHLCSKVFKMRGSLMVHMRVAHMGYNLGSLVKGGQVELILNEDKYNCPTCGKKFKKEQHVIQHLKTHEAKQWECDICSKMFTTKYFLKKHKRLHSGEMPYKCNICNKTFTFQQSYHKHRLYHKDDKPHTCVTCGRSFKELSTLHNHERIHTGEKPFACETCGKCFRQRVSYLVHRRIHTGVMPYKCTVCGKSFRYKVSQRTHKCPLQQMVNTQQANNLDQQSINLLNTQGSSNNLCSVQKDPIEKNQTLLNVMSNEENKYILIINNQGQHLLTKESNVGKMQTESIEEHKLDKPTDINDKTEERRDIWKSNIPNSPIVPKPLETSKKIYLKNNKPFQEDTSDFFSMVMSPIENGLSSPSAEMEHLRVSSPTQKNELKPYNHFRSATHNMDVNIMNTNIEQSFSSNHNVTNTLETINEESLKQLLYGIDDK